MKTSTETQHLPPKKSNWMRNLVQSLAGIFQDNPGSMTQDPSDDVDSIVKDMIDYTVLNNCNVTSNEPMFSVFSKNTAFYDV